LSTHPLRRFAFAAAVALAVAILADIRPSRADTVASLLGNFTINQFCGLRVGRSSVQVHYVVVYGQLPALRELHDADTNGDGVTSQAERDAYVGTLAPGFADGLELRLEGERTPLRAIRWSSSLPTEQGGFSLRVDVDFIAQLPAPITGAHTLRFTNRNYPGRLGWHEIVVNPLAGVAIFDTDAYDTSATGALSEALQALPVAGPLDERSVHLRFDTVTAPPGSAPLGPRPQSESPAVKSSANARGETLAAETEWIARKTRSLVGAISAPGLNPGVASWALLVALLLGAVHALSPGHGKTIVGAYLIGSRGTPRHAAFLGLTVTLTHTIGVFALGFATLYASRFVVPERLFPILSFVSALLVLGMGLALLVQRGRAAGRALRDVGGRRTPMFHLVERVRSGASFPGSSLLVRESAHAHVHLHDSTLHSHGGGPMHSHLPPGPPGGRISWKSLAALGISGGLVPCPSAMVLLLAAVALDKTAYGMLLVLVFSVGLALTLTAVGLVFLYARNRFSNRNAAARWPQLLPLASAAIITLLGLALCLAAVRSFS
jgi:nickel/cobalt transporter (NicO) family protein